MCSFKLEPQLQTKGTFVQKLNQKLKIYLHLSVVKISSSHKSNFGPMIIFSTIAYMGLGILQTQLILNHYLFFKKPLLIKSRQPKMGVCQPLCKYDQDFNTNQSSSKSLLINYLSQYDTEEWYPHIKRVIELTSFQSFSKNKYQKQTSSHTINNESDGQELSCYNKFTAMSAQQKGEELSSMLTNAYMIIDEEDMPHNNSKLLLPELASRNLFTSSMNVSVFGMVEDPEILKKRNDKLRAYDPDILKSLEGFVEFCNDIREFAVRNGSFIFQLILAFKGSILHVFKQLVYTKINEGNTKIRDKLVQSCSKFIYFMIDVLTTIFSLNKIKEVERDKCFFTEINLHTLITSLLFKQKDFEQIVKKVYLVSMKKQISNYIKNSQNTYQKFQLPIQFSLDKDTLKKLGITQKGETFQKNYNPLFKSTPTQAEPYHKCVQMISRITQINEPIGKLKLIYETALRVSKQIQKFYGNYYLPVPILDGEKFLQVARNILNRCQNENVAVQILITSDFVHNYYLISKKGSYLTPFLASVEDACKQ